MKLGWNEIRIKDQLYISKERQMEVLAKYLIFSMIPNHHKHGTVLQRHSILYLHTDPVIHLLSKCGHDS